LNPAFLIAGGCGAINRDISYITYKRLIQETLTVGKFEVSKIVPIQKDISEDEMLRVASALEQKSEHTIATGILQLIP
jgi:hypothetical protein